MQLRSHRAVRGPGERIFLSLSSHHQGKPQTLQWSFSNMKPAIFISVMERDKYSTDERIYVLCFSAWHGERSWQGLCHSCLLLPSLLRNNSPSPILQVLISAGISVSIWHWASAPYTEGAVNVLYNMFTTVSAGVGIQHQHSEPLGFGLKSHWGPWPFPNLNLDMLQL